MKGKKRGNVSRFWKVRCGFGKSWSDARKILDEVEQAGYTLEYDYCVDVDGDIKNIAVFEKYSILCLDGCHKHELFHGVKRYYHAEMVAELKHNWLSFKGEKLLDRNESILSLRREKLWKQNETLKNMELALSLLCRWGQKEKRPKLNKCQMLDSVDTRLIAERKNFLRRVKGLNIAADKLSTERQMQEN